jgi:D-arabinose 1-dehydrogenase-like Zn-dependent alcohol dehydrogenase
MTRITGVTYDGGYADYMIAKSDAVAELPDELEPTEAAPLLCAGVTTFNSLRNSGARPGDLVAVFGLGGLGHLGVQFASRMGYRTVAIGRGADKESLAKKLGAHIYIDSQATDAAAELAKLGGAKTILATVTEGAAMGAMVGGLAANGTLMVIGAGGAIQVPPYQLIRGRLTIKGWYSGTSIDSQDTLAFSVLAGVRPMIEVFSLDRAAEGYERMLSGKARFRVVLKM